MENRDDYISSLLVGNLTFRFLLSTLLMLVVLCDCMSGFVFAQEAQLQVVSPLSPDIAVLTKDEPQIKTMKIKNVTSNDLELESVTFRPSNLEDTPKEANEVKVTGLQRVTLAKGESREISVLFPKHTQMGEYEGWLYYATREKPGDYIPFYSFKVEITDPSSPLMSGVPAALVAFVLSLLVLIVTLWMGRSAKMPLGFFQSPGGGYSASKFQIWLWTLVIIFSFVYVFLRHGAVIEFPESVWWLLGISVGSTGTAKFITVRRLSRQAAATISSRQPAGQPQSIVDRLASMLSEEGQLSLMRLQMFGWTVVTALLFIVHVFRTEQLWDVPVGLLVLMGISHAGYLGDKGAAPDVTLQFDNLEPKSMSAAATPNASLLILGQNFADGVECYLNSVQLTIDPNILPNRLRVTLPAQGLTAGKYDLSLQNPVERVKVVKDVFEVT